MNINRLLFGLPLVAALSSHGVLAMDDLEALAGKWSVKKLSEQGQDYTQTIAVKKDKFVLQILGAEGRVVLYAEGDLKLDKLGPFNAAHFLKIRAGGSASDLRDVDDEYVCIYRLEEDTWTMALNFDKERQRQRPSLDVYRRVKATAEPATLVIDEIEMADTPQSGTWFLYFEAKVEGATRSYHVAGKGYDKNQVTIPVALETAQSPGRSKMQFQVATRRCG